MAAHQDIDGWGVRRSGALTSIALSEPKGRMTAAHATALGLALNGFARDAELYAMTFDADVLALDGKDVADDASTALAELVWRLDCFSKPIVSLMDGPVGEIGLAIALAGTHRVATGNTRFQISGPGNGRLPPGNVICSLADVSASTDAILAGAAVDARDALIRGWVTHTVERASFDEIRTGLAAAEPVDPLCDDRRAPLAVMAQDNKSREPASRPVILPDALPALAPTVRHAIAAIRPLGLRQALSNAARYDLALLRLGPGTTSARLDQEVQEITAPLPERRVLQAFRTA